MKTLLTFIIALLIPVYASAEITTKDAASTIEATYVAFKDFQANFTQKTDIQAVSRVQNSSGVIFIKKTAGTPMFRFDYAKPNQTIVSDGKNLWVYTKKNNQVVKSTIKSVSQNILAINYLTGIGNIDKDFTVEGSLKNNTYVLKLTPKKDSGFNSLTLFVSDKAIESYKQTKKIESFPILKTIVHDSTGNIINIQYYNIKFNKGLSSSKFSFTPPANAKVIKQ